MTGWLAMPRPNRTYVKVDDQLLDDDKLDGLPIGIKLLVVGALVDCWTTAARLRKDGFIPASRWAKVGNRASRRLMLERGFVESADGGVNVHNYLQHQRSRADIERIAEQRRKAGASGGHETAKRAASAAANAAAKPQQTGQQTGSSLAIYTETEAETETGGRPAGGPRQWSPSDALTQEGRTRRQPGRAAARPSQPGSQQPPGPGQLCPRCGAAIGSRDHPSRACPHSQGIADPEVSRKGAADARRLLGLPERPAEDGPPDDW